MIKKILKFMLDIIRKNVFLREHVLDARTAALKAVFLRYSKNSTTDDKLCVFEVFNGRNYSDSPKAIYLRMLNDERYKDFRYVWAFADTNKFKYLENNRNTSIVRYNSKDYMKVYAKAKYWFTPSRLPDYIVPKEDQKYVQFWHGTPLKRLGFDIEVKGENALHTISEWQRLYEYDASRYSYLMLPSRFTSEKLTSAFNLKKIGKDKCIHETGYPRNDTLFKFNDEYVSSLRRQLGIPEEKKIILYAPTWRDNQYATGVGYSYNLELDFVRFRENAGDKYVVLFRAHYLISKAIDLDKHEGFVYNVSSYTDVNDLYIMSDMIITDYSSVFFDYANLKRPILFYMYDLDEYKNNMRDFYIDLEELPGPIIEKENVLYREIQDIDSYWDRFKSKYEKFNKKFNYLDDANSSQRVLDIVMD